MKVNWHELDCPDEPGTARLSETVHHSSCRSSGLGREYRDGDDQRAPGPVVGFFAVGGLFLITLFM